MSSVVQLWSFRRLIGNLTQRELKVKYKRSILGWLWSLINPATTILIYSLVFGVFLRAQPPVAGDGHTKSFALFLFTGLVMWSLFSSTINSSMAALRSAGPLLQKVAFPPYCPPLASTLANLTQTLLEGLVLVVVMAIVGNIGPTALLLPFLLLLMLLFGLGIALVLSLLGAKYNDVGYLVTIALQLGFYSSPIIYPFSIVPEHVRGIPVRTLIQYNPMTQFIGAARDVMYHLQAPSAARLLGLTAVSLITVASGWAIFQRFSANVSEVL
jgi:ABC-type polysaccharide/polyol phosphate export permease